MFSIPRFQRYAFACMALLTAAVAPRALALDPGRSLTQYVHRIWQMQQGLPQATIFSIWQTHDGYLWLGTQAGPMRFDGVRFTTPDEAGPLQSRWVRSLLEDDQHNLWIGTNESGLARL